MAAMTSGSTATERSAHRSRAKASKSKKASTQQEAAGRTPSEPQCDDSGALIHRTVETEIIPRLLLGFKHNEWDTRPKEQIEGLRVLAISEVPALLDALLENRLQVAKDIVDRLTQIGVARADLLLNLLSPVARRLGEYWEADLCTFVDVTIAMGSLQVLARHAGSDEREQRFGRSPRIMLLPTFGEQHTFPLLILDAFFTRAGWLVSRDMAFEPEAVFARQKLLQPHCIGLTLSNEGLLDRLASDIDTLRCTNSKQKVRIIVGGAAFVDRPDRVELVGADGSARNAPEAVALAERLVRMSGALEPVASA
jgi:methanogenic corrinoid protein MtbC1